MADVGLPASCYIHAVTCIRQLFQQTIGKCNCNLILTDLSSATGFPHYTGKSVSLNRCICIVHVHIKDVFKMGDKSHQKAFSPDLEESNYIRPCLINPVFKVHLLH